MEQAKANGALVDLSREDREKLVKLNEQPRRASLIEELIGSDEYRALSTAMQWTGDTPETALATARELQHYPIEFTEFEFGAASIFMAGGQWSQHKVEERNKHGLPCLVVNKLQMVYSYAVGTCITQQLPAKDIPGHAYVEALTDEQKEMLLVVLWRRNADAQRFHNWSISRYVQLVAATA